MKNGNKIIEYCIIWWKCNFHFIFLFVFEDFSVRLGIIKFINFKLNQSFKENTGTGRSYWKKKKTKFIPREHLLPITMLLSCNDGGFNRRKKNIWKRVYGLHIHDYAIAKDISAIVESLIIHVARINWGDERLYCNLHLC